MSMIHGNPSGKEIEFRPLAETDVPELLELWHRAGLSIREQGRDRPERIAAEMERDDSLFLGAWQSAFLVGVVLVNHEGRKGWINRLAVDPAMRRRGLAVELVRRAEAWLREQGIAITGALIEADNLASQELFLALGFRKHSDIHYFSKRESSGT